jgi:hypothetical protein
METQAAPSGTQVASPWPARSRVSRTELDPVSFWIGAPQSIQIASRWCTASAAIPTPNSTSE